MVWIIRKIHHARKNIEGTHFLFITSNHNTDMLLRYFRYSVNISLLLLYVQIMLCHKHNKCTLQHDVQIKMEKPR